MPLSESDTCRKYITPKIYQAGWSDDQIYQERTFTDGRIIIGDKIKRGKQKRADALEAIIAAVYLDQGLDKAIEVVENLVIKQ